MPFIIDIDHMADTKAKTGTNANAVGVCGPRTYRGNGQELKAEFRMLTDDRELVYEGRSDYESNFQPLDCFGAPNAGCTILQYRNADTGKFEDI